MKRIDKIKQVAAADCTEVHKLSYGSNSADVGGRGWTGTDGVSLITGKNFNTLSLAATYNNRLYLDPVHSCKPLIEYSQCFDFMYRLAQDLRIRVREPNNWRVICEFMFKYNKI